MFTNTAGNVGSLSGSYDLPCSITSRICIPVCTCRYVHMLIVEFPNNEPNFGSHPVQGASLPFHV